MSQTTDVDSADTSAIEYDSYGSDSWSLIQTTGNGAVFSQTLTRVESTGGAVFKFHGTSVQVYGTVTPPSTSGDTVTSTYTLDGSGTTPYSSQQVSSDSSEVDGALFFDSGTLSDGEHILVINVTSASADAPYFLDYIQYAKTTVSTTTSATSTSTSTTASTSATSALSNDKSGSNTGAIVGGVVGGVVFLILVAVGIFLFLRYFRHRIGLSGRKRGGRDVVEEGLDAEEPKSDVSSPWSGSHPEPLLGGPPTSHAGAPTAPYASTIVPDDSASQVAGRLYAAELAQQRLHAVGFAPPQAGASGATGAAAGAAGGSRDSKVVPAAVPEEAEVEPETVQHQDSGIRFRDGELPPVALPPQLPEEEERPPQYGTAP